MEKEKSNSKKMEPIIIIHGGAGDIIDERVPAKFHGMKIAVRIAFKILEETDDPVTTVEKAVNVMENLPAFNAGYGSVLTCSGEVEMDSLIIRGSNLQAGAVGAVRHIANPISLARRVMENTSHVMLVGSAAENFAVSQGFQLIPTKCLIPPRTNHSSTGEFQQQKTTETYFDVGTVGAVAINSKGEIAVATSTGGISGKLDGRVGDSPIIGGGTFADDGICGISATGIGEAIMRANLCSRISQHLQAGSSPIEAGKTALEYMSLKINDSTAGVIIITANGEIAYPHNSTRMAWAYARKSDPLLHFGINQEQDFTEPIGSSSVPFPPPPEPDCDSIRL